MKLKSDIHQLLVRIFPFHLKWCSSYILASRAPFKAKGKNLNWRVRHSTRNYSFEKKFPAGDARKAAIAELKLKAEQSKSAFSFIFLTYITTSSHTETYLTLNVVAPKVV